PVPARPPSGCRSVRTYTLAACLEAAAQRPRPAPRHRHAETWRWRKLAGWWACLAEEHPGALGALRYARGGFPDSSWAGFRSRRDLQYLQKESRWFDVDGSAIDAVGPTRH